MNIYVYMYLFICVCVIFFLWFVLLGCILRNLLEQSIETLHEFFKKTLTFFDDYVNVSCY